MAASVGEQAAQRPSVTHAERAMNTDGMNTAIFDHIARTRRELAGWLSGIDEETWEAPTLCAGWTVRVVAGHLTAPLLLSNAQIFVNGAKAGFRFHRLMDQTARRLASRPTADIVRTLDEKAEGRWVPPLAGPRAILLDVTTHQMDIRWPQKDPPDLDPSVALTLFNFLVSGNIVLKVATPNRFSGVRLEAEDVDWAYGDGPVARGPADALLLAMVGRAAGIDRLTGDGVGVLRGRAG
jgi:uncharacterized protein (TIGR03083 family)